MSSSMPAFSTPHAGKPQTPFRRVATAIFCSPLQVSRRPRPRSNCLDSARPSINRPNLYTPLPAVALLTPSPSTDSIVITSLRRAPFCCHEDLVTMSRPELVGVAQSINRHLPTALQISCGDDLHDADIRRAIEVLVGIRAETKPSAPVLGSPSRVARTKSMTAALADEAPRDMDVDLSTTDSQTSVILSSPLSPRRRARLEILKEEQEYEEPWKKRRSASPENNPAPASAGPVFAAAGTRLVENLDMSASHLLSSDSNEDILPLTDVQEVVQHQLFPRLFSRSPQPRQVVIRLPFVSSPEAQLSRVLRSQSQRASTNSTSPQVLTLRRAQSNASVMLKRTKYHFRRQRGTITPKALDRLNAPEVVRKSRALPIVPTGFALVDFIIPRPRIESVPTIVS